MCPFLVYIYFLYWFRIKNVADAPVLTLKLYHDLQSWHAIDKEGSKAAIRKMDLYTDYLNGRSVVLALVSDFVNSESKEAMARKLTTIEAVSLRIGKPPAPRIYEESSLVDFINEESWLILKLTNIKPSFLNQQCSE